MSKFSSQSVLNLFHFTKEQEIGYFIPQALWIAHQKGGLAFMERGYSAPQDLWLAHRLKRYLENGANIHETTPNAATYPQKIFDGYQVIHYAAYYGLRHVYQVAKSAGADLGAKVGFLEETPFQIIARRINANYKLFNSQKAYEYLAFKMIEEGANVHEADNAGYTPLHRTESPALVQKLIEMNVDVNACNEKNNNALHEAVQIYKAFNQNKCSPEMVKHSLFIQEQAYQKAVLLLNAGINTKQKNQNGETPFDLIRDDYWHDYSNSKMYQLLEKNAHPQTIKKAKRAITSRFLDWQRD